MTILFGSLFFGMYIIFDKRVDFLKEVLVAPLSRTTIFFGKVLGGSTDGMIQIIVLMILGSLFFGIHFTAYSVVVTLVVIMLLMTSIISLGLTIGSVMTSPEGFGLVTSFLIFPALPPERRALPGQEPAFVALRLRCREPGLLFRGRAEDGHTRDAQRIRAAGGLRGADSFRGRHGNDRNVRFQEDEVLKRIDLSPVFIPIHIPSGSFTKPMAKSSSSQSFIAMGAPAATSLL